MSEFCVIGLGNFGSTVARQLTEKGAKVTAVDIDKAKVQEAQAYVNLAILGSATDRNFLENLQVENFECFVVSTGEDSHASILVTLYLKELKARRIIVKANSHDHARILKKVGADESVIPEEEMARKLAHTIARPNVVDFLPLSDEYSIAEVLTPEKFVGKSIMKLKLRQKYHVDVIAIKNQQTGQFNFIPQAQYEIQESDILVVLGKQDDIEQIRL